MGYSLYIIRAENEQTIQHNKVISQFGQVEIITPQANHLQTQIKIPIQSLDGGTQGFIG